MSKLIRCGRLMDGTGQSPAIDAAILVDEGRIAAVGHAREFAGYSGEIVDLPGATVIPGLIDAHVHLFPYCPDQTAALYLRWG